MHCGCINALQYFPKGSASSPQYFSLVLHLQNKQLTMRIGVNAACLLQESPADTGNIITDMLTGLTRLHPEHTFIFFYDSAPSPAVQWPENVMKVVVPLKGHRSWQEYLWLEWKLKRAIQQQQLDLFLSLDGRLPLGSKVPAQLLVTDTGFLHDVAGIPASRKRARQKNMIRYLQKAGEVRVLSHTLKEDLLRYAPEIEGKLKVLQPEVSSAYKPLEWEEREDVKREFAGGVEYFIAVGSLHPRNNIMPLLKAFSALKRRLHSNMKLVLAGSATAAGEEITASLPSYKYRNDIVLLQDADQQTLARAIGGAYAMIYTSRFAGVAMPVYAALQCQVPVIALESAVAREAGGEAVLYADPENLEDLANKMCLIYKDEELRSRLLGKIIPPAAAGNVEMLIG